MSDSVALIGLVHPALAEAIYIDTILVENVEEFKKWGPLGANGRPLISKAGETFRAFITALESLGYKVEHRILNAADYGDPTTRKRFFMIARRGGKKITWPQATHSVNPQPRPVRRGQKEVARSSRD